MDAAVWAKCRMHSRCTRTRRRRDRADSKLIEDLGAESLDFLDIVYRLERAFDIRFLAAVSSLCSGRGRWNL